MKARINEYQLGRNELVRMTDKFLSLVMRGLIAVNGQILESKVSPVWGEANIVVFTVGIPEGKEIEFEKYTGLSLTGV